MFMMSENSGAYSCELNARVSTVKIFANWRVVTKGRKGEIGYVFYRNRRVVCDVELQTIFS